MLRQFCYDKFENTKLLRQFCHDKFIKNMPDFNDTDEANRNIFDNIENSFQNMTEYFNNQNLLSWNDKVSIGLLLIYIFVSWFKKY